MDKYTTAKDRDACWAARDAYFSCLDAAAAPTVGGPAPDAPLSSDGACATQRQAYERGCLSSWRRHWDERYRNGRLIVGRK